MAHRRLRRSLTIEKLESRYVLNAAPVLDTTASPEMLPIVEDAGAPIGQVGTLVSDLIHSGGPLSNYSDADGDAPGIAITGVNLQGGTLWYSVDDGVTWADVGAVSDAVPKLLGANVVTRVYLQPAPDFSGAIDDVISFKAWDQYGVLTQLGGDIEGEAVGDYFGRCVAVSADGSTVAVGGRYNDQNGVNSGHIRVFTLADSAWQQLGSDIYGESAGDEAGFHIALSADGRTIAIGARRNDGNGVDAGHARVYRWSVSNWEQLGNDIEGEAPGDWAGQQATLSADGDTIAIGSPLNDANGPDSGSVRVFDWLGTHWSQRGLTILGEAAGDQLGISAALSADGMTVAIGAHLNNGSGVQSGHTRVYRWADSAWVQMGDDINGEAAYDWSGTTTALSANGLTLAIAARYNDGNGISAGHVRVYSWDGSAWQQVGNDVDGDAAGDVFGWWMSLSANGETMVVGAKNSDSNGVDSGQFSVYRLSGGTWVRVGENVYGDAPGDQLGYYVAISADSQTIAAGLPGTSAKPGTARVYRYAPTASSFSQVVDTVAIRVTATNDAPVLDTTASPELLPVTEDAGAPIGEVGTLISDLIDSGGPLNNFTDADGDTPGIAITGVNLHGGRLWYTDNSGLTWTPVVDVDASSPLALRADMFSRLYFQPAENFSGYIDDLISFRASDQTLAISTAASPVLGNKERELFGVNVALSDDGRTIAVFARWGGYVRVLRLIDGQWQQLGEEVGPHFWGQYNGVSLSGDGNTLAFAGQFDNEGWDSGGRTYVYAWANGSWTQLGSDIVGEASGDKFGASLALSSDGKTIAIGAPFNDGGGRWSGHVRIYKYEAGDWRKLGGDIDGVAPGDELGRSVAISSDGQTVAVGAPYDNSNGSEAGSVKVFQWLGDAWVQIGVSLVGEAGDRFGDSVSLSVDGETLAIGSPGAFGGAGAARVYHLIGDGWQLAGDEIGAEPGWRKTGFPVYLSGDGRLLAVSAKSTDWVPDSLENQVVHLYRWTGVAWNLVSSEGVGDGGADWQMPCVGLSRNGLVIAAGSPHHPWVGEFRDRGQMSVFGVTPGANSLSAAGDTAGIMVVAVNDAPALDPGASPELLPVTEDAGAPIGEVGTLISDLIDSGGPLKNFSDADGDTPGIAITGVNLQGGTLWYSVNGGVTWADVGIVSDAEPKLLAANAATRVYFQPAADFSGTIGDVISFKAWDQYGVWTMLGGDIDGEASGDRSGISVSLSADGETVAIGAISNDGNGNNSGHARMYRWNGSAWSQQGSDVDGEAVGDQSGHLVSLSADGETVAISTIYNDGNGADSGHVRIYRWNGTTWAQQGSDIDGEAAGDYSGWSVSLSADGERVAIGAPKNDGNDADSGHVRIYRWNGTTWAQQGSDIDGEATYDYSGWSVSLSADGEAVAIGAYRNDGNGNDSGHVRIYRWNGTTWAQQGSDIDGEAVGDYSGSSVSLSSDGETVAIGAINNDGNGTGSGHVRIYRWSGSAWSQQGRDMDGEAAWDQSGSSVSLSADSQTVAIGARHNDGNGTDSGHVRIYRWNGAAWSQQGSDIDGKANAFSGWSVSMSPDGETLAIGAPNDSGTYSGNVRIYRLTPAASSFSLVTDTVSISVTRINNAPTAVSLTNVVASLAENSDTSAGINVATISVTDDGLGNNTLALSGADAAAFEIIGDELFLKAGVSLDYETKPSYAITVEAVDNSVAGSTPATASLTIQITDVNEAPTAVVLTNAVTSLAENFDTSSAVKLAVISVSDDAIGNNLLSLSGADADDFEIVGDELFLKAGVTLGPSKDKQFYSISIDARDTEHEDVVSAAFRLDIVSALATSDSVITFASNGQWVLSASEGDSFTSNIYAQWNPAVDWQDFLSGDFNGDGTTDVAARTGGGQWWAVSNQGNGTGVTQKMGRWSGAIEWLDVIAGDFNGDGRADMAGRTATGAWWAALTDVDGVGSRNKLLGIWNGSRTWATVFTGDFNGDGRTDIAGRNDLGEWWVVAMDQNGHSSTALSGSWTTRFNWSNIMPGDFNGDGRTDIIARLDNGQWYAAIALDRSRPVFGSVLMGAWSTAVAWGDVQVGDFDGDGRSDLLGRTAGGAWWASISKTDSVGFRNQAMGIWSILVSWAAITTGDFDGDGRDDLLGRVAPSPGQAGGRYWVGLTRGNGFDTTLWAKVDFPAGVSSKVFFIDSF